MQHNLIIAYAYATAIFRIAIENKSLEKWKKFLIKLLHISQIQDVNQFFHSIYPANIIQKIILLFFTDNLDIYSKNLIQLLVINKRLYLIENIFHKFIKLYNEYYNIVNVELTTVHTLNIQQKKKISVILENKLNKRINLICTVDNSILYGVIIRYNNMVIDNSIINTFNELSNFLIT